MARDLTQEREDFCKPIAAKILSVLAAETDLHMGQQNQEELDAYFKNLFSEKIEPIIREADIKLSDMTFIFSLILQPLNNLKTAMVDAVNQAYDTCSAFKFGVQDIGDIKLSDIVRIQTEAVATIPKKE